jgi:hypothetical protein
MTSTRIEAATPREAVFDLTVQHQIEGYEKHDQKQQTLGKGDGS